MRRTGKQGSAVKSPAQPRDGEVSGGAVGYRSRSDCARSFAARLPSPWDVDVARALPCGPKDPAATPWPGHRLFGCAGPASGGSALAPADRGAFGLLLPDSGFRRRGGGELGVGTGEGAPFSSCLVLELPALLPAIPASCGSLTSSRIPALALGLPHWASCGSLPNGSVHLDLGPGVSKLQPVTTFSPGPTFMALELRICLDF